jgi:hypothetical protein
MDLITRNFQLSFYTTAVTAWLQIGSTVTASYLTDMAGQDYIISRS